MSDALEIPADNRVQFRAAPDLVEWLVARARRTYSDPRLGQRAHIELVMWRAVLTEELRRLPFTLPELGAVADVMNGTMLMDAVPVRGSVSSVAAEVIDAFRADQGAYGRKWAVDEATLIDKLVRLGPAASIAFQDALALWWATEADHSVEGWATVGIVVREAPDKP